MSGYATVRRVLRSAVAGWFEHRCTTLAAALAFYALFALAPIVLMSVYAAGNFLNEDQVQQRTLGWLSEFMGSDLAAALVDTVKMPELSVKARLFAAVALLFGATGFFVELQEALHLIWNSRKRPHGVRRFLRGRSLSFLLVLLSGAILSMSFVASTAFSVVERLLKDRVSESLRLAGSAQSLAAFVLLAVLLIFIFRFLPEGDSRLADVWLGGLATAVLLTAGKWGVGLYLRYAALASAYGAAGSLVMVLLWVYVSALILLLGAEFTCAWARRGEVS